MKGQLLILFFLLFHHVGTTQVPTDSLFQIWKDSTESDSVGVYTLKSVIWDHFLFKDTDTAMILAQEMIDYSDLQSDELPVRKTTEE
ncbi:MAG: hypothetical protein R3275_09725 [Saprospiraceae bacterium]|nr:hypothetical protein [Saprospiraceae bacterium]